jgi:hypothetical protein
MQFYALVNSNGVEEVEAAGLPKIKEIQNLVGVPGQEAFFEAVYSCYSDRSIAILCDDDFLRNNYQSTLVTPRGIVLQGQLLILAVAPQIEYFCLWNRQQVEIFKRETKLYQAISR